MFAKTPLGEWTTRWVLDGDLSFAEDDVEKNTISTFLIACHPGLVPVSTYALVTPATVPGTALPSPPFDKLTKEL